MKLTALLYFVLSLFGVETGGSTFVNRTVVDGADVLYSKASTQAGVAHFECLRSASGRCYYTLFPSDCASTPTTGCRSEPVERFAIANGTSRQLTGLAAFHLCVSSGDEPLAPDCERPQPIAAR